MKARTLFILALALTTVMSLAPPALAHHSFAAEYDADKPVTLTGSVTKMAWINPHSWIYIDVKKADGTVSFLHVNVNPRVRIDPGHLGNGTSQRHRLIRIIFGRK